MNQNNGPPAIVQTSVSELIAAGKALHNGLKRDERAALDKAVQLGAILNRLKESCGHGEYLPALEKMGIPRQRAWEYRRLAKCPTSDISSWASLRDALATIGNAPEAGDSPSPTQANNGCTPTTSSTPTSRADRVGQLLPKPFVLREREFEGDTEGEVTAKAGVGSCPEPPTPHEPIIPERLKQYFVDVEKFEQVARLAERLANLLQEIEQTPAYGKAVEGKGHKRFSTYVRTAAQAIGAMTPKRPCPHCGDGEHPPSLDSEPCMACGDKGYQTAEDLAP